MTKYDDLLTTVMKGYTASVFEDIKASDLLWRGMMPRHKPRTAEQRAEDERKFFLADTLKDIAFEWDVYDLLHEDCQDW